MNLKLFQYVQCRAVDNSDYWSQNPPLQIAISIVASMSVMSHKHLQVPSNNSFLRQLSWVMSMLLSSSVEFAANFCGCSEFLSSYLAHSFQTFVVMISGQGQRENWISYQSLGSYWPSCPQEISTLNLWDLPCLTWGSTITKSSLFLDGLK